MHYNYKIFAAACEPEIKMYKKNAESHDLDDGRPRSPSEIDPVETRSRIQLYTCIHLYAYVTYVKYYRRDVAG